MDRNLNRVAIFLMLVMATLHAQSNNPTQYFYDDLGRLSKVVDQKGNVATYTYDAAGNLLSIARSSLPSLNALAILGFTPQQGGIGTRVTIQGQNFNTTPSGNNVQFNGTPATVISATANSLTVTVPTGSTTGPITVSVGSSTATSSSNFTVLQTPVVGSIQPSNAVQGGTLGNFKITGINLAAASFSFLPTFSPLAITPSNLTISPDGTSATMSLTLAPSAVGSFTAVATNSSGTSSQVPGPNNTLTILSGSPSADADGDGLTNIYEQAIGSDPVNPSTANDGIPDGWALFFGLNPSSPSAAGQTAPNGLSYLQSFQLGLNPLITTLAPPGVARVSPADGATNYPTNGVIVVRFNEPLQTPVTLAAAQAAINAGLPAGSNFSSANAAAAAQVLQAFLLRTCCAGTAAVPNTVQLLQNGRPIPGTVNLSNDGLSLVFAPTQPLSSSTTYTVLVQGVKAASGIAMSGTFQSSFTTGLTTNLTNGAAVLTSPANFAQGVPTNAAYMVEFNKQVDPSSLTPQTFFVRDTFTGQNVPGMLQVDASGFTASFVPQTLYAVEHSFQVTISGVLDLTEHRFPTSVFSFTTGFIPETTAPSLVAVSPSNATAGLPINTLVRAQFSAPLSVITANSGFQVLQGGNPVLGAIALSNGNTFVTFTPTSPLNPNTVYTISVTNQITDVAENPLSNPGTFTFVTGAVADAVVPQITTVTPANGANNVPTNAVIQLQFSKRVDSLTVTAADFVVFADATVRPQELGIPISGTITVAPDGLMATFAPSAPLRPSTNYSIANTGIEDLEGHGVQFFISRFSTGLGPATTAPTVLQVSPLNGASGVPVNPQVVIVASAPVSAASVNGSAITLTAGGTLVSGSTSLSNDRTTLTFVPASLLAVSTTYTVTASGFTDQAGNTVTPFTSTFTTGTSGVANTTRPALTAVSPLNGATGVPTTSPIVLTFSEAINPAAVNLNTVSANALGEQLAGNYAVDATGTVVTFTPLSPLPGNTSIFVVVQGVTDLSGNISNLFESSFTTAAGTDTVAPKVVMVTPGNGATGIGLNASVVLTFSKSLKRSTVNNNTVALLVNGNRFGPISVSADNRVVTLTPGFLPASTAVAVVATSGVTDLAGNPLIDFESSFTTAAGFDTDHPAVVGQRPGNGATDVPLNTSVVLYVSEEMNAATVQGALHVSQNGVLVTGTTQVSDSGQVVVFTPSTPWLNSALIRIALDNTAQDVDGNPLSAYQGFFQTVADPTTTPPSIVNLSPDGTSAVPTNAVIDVGFNQPLDPATVNSTTARLLQNTLGPNTCCSFAVVPSAISLLEGGTVVRIAPTAPLAANAFSEVEINPGLQGANGKSFPADEVVLSFVTAGNADPLLPAILAVSPPNGAGNVGDNAEVRVAFNKPISPLTVNATTIQLTGGGTTQVPDSISFSNDNQSVMLVPHGPLPDNTVMTLTISGVTDQVGNAVPSQITTFTTGTGPDLIAPSVTAENPFNGATNVPVTAPITLQTNEPIDPASINQNTLLITDGLTGQSVTGSYSVSLDGQTINFLPSRPLAVGRNFSVSFNNHGITDLAGNLLGCAGLCDYSFTTGFTASTTGPSVLGVSPGNGSAGIPINSQVVVQFSEPVDALTVNQVTLSSGGTVNVISRLSNANQMLTLIPVLPLNPNTTYSINVAGVQDLSGNALTAPSTTTFTTGAGADLTPLVVTTVSPANGGTGVPTNGLIQLQFNKQADAATVTAADFQVFPQATGILIPGAVSVSTDGLTATFTPNPPLVPATNYSVRATSAIADLQGNTLPVFSSSFTTGVGAVTTPPTVLQVSPPNGASGVPVNPQVVIAVSAPVSAASINSGAITVTSGGTAVSGNISLNSDHSQLTFVPANLLATSTTYAVRASGFTDQAGNAVTPFTSTFTTGTLAKTTGPTVAAVSPANGATGVPTTSTIVLTFNEAIDPVTVNLNTVPIFASGLFGEQLAGSYTVDATGTVVTFTPASPLPGNTLIFVGLNQGVLDLSGNPFIFNPSCECTFSSSFTTTAGTDTTVPTVLMVTPGNGATGIGLNATVVMTFSKSLNRNTINGNTVALLANGSKLNSAISISADNRVVTLNPGTLSASSTVTAVATTGVTDLVGNALSNFESSFTTAAAFDKTHPAVVTQRPGNGATGVPLNETVVLYINEPMNVATIPAALHVAQNGVLASGTTQVSDSGQVVVFTPSTPWQNNALIQIFMDNAALDVDGNSLSAYQGSFHTVADTSAVPPSVVSNSPNRNATGVPTNVVIDIGFNEPLDAATVNTATVTVFQNFCCPTPVVPITVTLLNGGTVVHITPNAPLAANTQYQVQITGGIHGTNGLRLPFDGEEVTFFTTGAGTVTATPTILSVSPPNGSVNVGDNSEVRIVFSEPIDSLTVSGTTIQLTGGGTAQVPDSISFSNNDQSVVLVPHGPLPDNTLMSLTIAGVTDLAGNVVAPQTTTFTTGTGPHLVAPSVISENPFNGATNVPVTAAIILQTNEPIDPGSVNQNSLLVRDGSTGQIVSGSYSVSTDGQTINFLPNTPLPVDRAFSVFFNNRGITDLAGNLLSCAGLCNYSFTTGLTASTPAPSVVGVSPPNGSTGIPINSQLVVQFSEPVDALTVNQVAVSSGAGTVNVIGRLSNANQTLTLIPVAALNPNTAYTLNVTGVQDLIGNALTAASTTTFTTGTGADLTSLTVATVSPANGAAGAPTNSLIQVQFNKRVDPVTVTAADLQVFPQATGIPIPGTVSVSTDGLTATFAPNPPLVPATNYSVRATNAIADLQGNGLPSFSSSFTTGVGAVTTPLTVLQVSPSNGTSGVPVNPQVVVVMSAPVGVASVNNGAITVTTGGTSVGGNISLNSDHTVMTFVTSSLLTVSTTYTITVNGLTDQAGNVVTPFTSTFTTGTSGAANTSGPTVTAVSPANGATGVSTNSTIVLTFSEAIDPVTVNVNSVPMVANVFGEQVAGSYTVDATGTVVTFTPASPLPENTVISVNENGVSDLSGNAGNRFSSSFTTGVGTDTTAPTVLMVTPGNGATGIGLNASAALSFSKSLNRNTVNNNTVALLANGSRLGSSINISADNRVVTLSAGTLPASSTVTVVATTGVTDLVGNALATFESSFTTAAALDSAHPTVVAQRPANGATGVPLNASVVLYVNETMNAATVSGALHVSQNGVLVSGTTQVSDSGQVVVFTPSAPWQNNALIQVFLDTTALDVDGNSLSAYQGSFQTLTITPALVSVNPPSDRFFQSPVPTNVVIELEFNEAVDSASLNTVRLLQNLFQPIPITLSQLNNGTVVQATPNLPLAANTNYGLMFRGNFVSFFRTGAGADTTQPTIVSVSPPNGSANVGDNAHVRVVFSKAVNPVTISGTTVQLTGGGATEVPDSISFSGNQNVVLVPHAPLPDNTLMTLSIAGVTDVAGNVVTPQTTTFTTGMGPDLLTPAVINQNPPNGASNVPLNTLITLQTSEPIDPGSVSSNTLTLFDFSSSQVIQGSYSVSPDGQTIMFLPNAPLPGRSTFDIFFAGQGITDLAGNLLGCSRLCGPLFSTGTTSNTTGPSVVGVSPANGLTGVPINAQVAVQFSEPVDALTINQVTLSNGVPVNVTSRLSNANQTLTLIPIVPLNTNTTYTISVTGVQDLSGNTLTAPSTTTFMTGTAPVLTPLTVTTAGPGNGAGGVPTNTVIQMQFSNPLNPLTVVPADFLVTQQVTGVSVPGTISVSPDGLTVTFRPNSALSPLTSYVVQATSSILDLEGQNLQSFSSMFNTGTTASTIGPSIAGVSPPSGLTDIPTNAQVVIQFSEAVDALTLNQMTLSSGGSPVNVASRLSIGNQTLTLTPAPRLNSNTTYTLNVTGVLDLSGNPLTASSTTTFTTGAGADFTGPTVTTVNPANGTFSAPTSSAIQIQFSKRIDPLTVTTADFLLFAGFGGAAVPGTISVSTDGLTAMLTPSRALSPSTFYGIQATSGIVDLEGHALQGFSTFFRTGTQ